MSFFEGMFGIPHGANPDENICDRCGCGFFTGVGGVHNLCPECAGDNSQRCLGCFKMVPSDQRTINLGDYFLDPNEQPMFCSRACFRIFSLREYYECPDCGDDAVGCECVG